MFTLKQKGKLAALAACCMLSLAAPARAESAAQYQSQFGASIDEGKYDREILVTANTRWINVVAGQVIRFVVADAAGGTAGLRKSTSYGTNLGNTRHNGHALQRGRSTG